MDKIRFFFKLISLLLLASLLLLIFNSFYIKGYYYNDIYGEVEKFRQEIPNDIKICNFGSSHGLASFKYDEGESAFNFALSGEDLYHNYAKLRQYYKHMSEGCVIFLPISYFSFCTDTDAPSDKRYYLFLDTDYIKGYSLETLLNVKYFPVLRSGDGILKDLVNEEKMASIFADKKEVAEGEANTNNYSANVVTTEATEAENSSDTDMDALNPEVLYNSDYVPSDSELYEFADLRSKSWHSEFTTKNQYMDENIGILEDMISFCIEHRLKPILVSTPINHVLNDMFGDELKEYFYDNIDKVVEDTGITYLDYSHEAEFSDNNGYFSNADHMNRPGGLAFTAELKEYLKQNSLYPN